MFFFFFFFSSRRRHTRYWRDWSSDVCSSDLVGDLGLVASFGEGFEAGLDQGAHPAAKHRLLAEEVGFGLLGEGGLDATGPEPTNAFGVGQGQVPRLTAGILLDRHQHRHTPPLGILPTDQMSGTLGRDECHIDAFWRLDVAEADVEAVTEEQGIAG